MHSVPCIDRHPCPVPFVSLIPALLILPHDLEGRSDECQPHEALTGHSTRHSRDVLPREALRFTVDRYLYIRRSGTFIYIGHNQATDQETVLATVQCNRQSDRIANPFTIHPIGSPTSPSPCTRSSLRAGHGGGGSLPICQRQLY